ncbi:MAG: DUF3455 domain-containing protein [Usitatibacter sp.]
MKRHNAFPWMIAVAMTAAAAVEPPAVEDRLRPAANEDLAFVLDAHGAQIYTCKAIDGAYRWTFVAPEATLLENGKIVGSHGAGPVWESVGDHSSARGTVRERQDGGASNIPWLLLAATSQGSGRFSGVTSVQRVDTHGGVEPAAPCNAAFEGRDARVKYTAAYYFYKKRPSAVAY